MSLIAAFARSIFDEIEAICEPCHHCALPTARRCPEALVDAPLCADCSPVCLATQCSSAQMPQTRDELLVAIYAAVDAIDDADAAVNADVEWVHGAAAFRAALRRSDARRALDELATDVFCETCSATQAVQTLHRCCPVWRALRRQ